MEVEIGVLYVVVEVEVVVVEVVDVVVEFSDVLDGRGVEVVRLLSFDTTCGFLQ